MRFYRFRAMRNLLGDFKELERQSIYFASREQLNDPMEGFRDFFWHGDTIIWRNLFRHYLFCLDHTYVRHLTYGKEDPDLWKLALPVRESLADSPPEYCARFGRLQQRLFGMQAVANLLAGLAASGRKVRQHELRFYLQYVHYFALEACLSVAAEDGLIPGRDRPLVLPRDLLAGTDFFDALSKLSSKPAGAHDSADAFFQFAAQVQAQSELIYRYNDVIDPADHNKNLLVLNFPERYLRAIETLAFPPWYTACFMSECTNSSVWGHYGANHTGTCLIFESHQVNGRPCLQLTGYNSTDGSELFKGQMNFAFDQVRYAEAYARLDFFRLLGQLPPPTLASMWYRDMDGNVSECAKPLHEDAEAWRANYWECFQADVLRKSKDWAYENEHRLVLHQGVVVDYSVAEHRTLTYEFSSLHGVIFGIHTSMEDKAEIVRIVREKCAREQRRDFTFYQAHYSSTSGNIEHVPLSLLRLKPR